MPFLVFFWCLSLPFEVKMVLLLPLGVRAFDHKVSMRDCQELCGRHILASFAKYEHRAE